MPFKFELSIVSRGHVLGMYFDVSYKCVACERGDGVSTRQALHAPTSAGACRTWRHRVRDQRDTLSGYNPLKIEILIKWGADVGHDTARRPRRCVAWAMTGLIRCCSFRFTPTLSQRPHIYDVPLLPPGCHVEAVGSPCAGNTRPGTR